VKKKEKRRTVPQYKRNNWYSILRKNAVRAGQKIILVFYIGEEKRNKQEKSPLTELQNRCIVTIQ